MLNYLSIWFFLRFIGHRNRFEKLRNSENREIEIKAEYLMFGVDPLYSLVNNIQINIRLL